MKITVLLKKDGDDLKGEFLSGHNRLKYLKRLIPSAEFEPYILKEYDGFLRRVLKRTPVRNKTDVFVYDGISYKVIWIKSSFVDTILNRLWGEKYFLYIELERFVQRLPSSDLIIAHSYYPGYVANEFSAKNGTPYTVTWHGSDIHSNPKRSNKLRKKTATIIEDAYVNYFVSRNLLALSSYITEKGNKKVLYNGVNNEMFSHLEEGDKSILKQQHHITSPLNMAFIGNLYPVKNVMVLPDVFSDVQAEYGDTVSFHIIGDGNLRKQLEEKFKEKSLNVRFWGNVQPELIPGIINVMDLIVLPSLNEGLPLVAIECMACGTPLLGSDVGGIKEAVGEEFVIPLGDGFVDAFSKRACEILSEHPVVELKDQFLWANTAIAEKKSLDEIMKKNE